MPSINKTDLSSQEPMNLEVRLFVKFIFFDTYFIKRFCNQASGEPHQRVWCENRVQIWPWFDKCVFPEAWSQNFSMEYVSKKYEIDKKSNLQVHWFLETEISLIDRMAFSCYLRNLLRQSIRDNLMFWILYFYACIQEVAKKLLKWGQIDYESLRDYNYMRFSLMFGSGVL